MKRMLGKFINTIIFTFIFSYIAVVLVEQQVKIMDFDKDKKVYSELIQEEKLRNEQLTKKKDELTSSEYIEKVAREKLGLVMPYETVFIDGNI